MPNCKFLPFHVFWAELIGSCVLRAVATARNSIRKTWAKRRGEVEGEGVKKERERRTRRQRKRKIFEKKVAREGRRTRERLMTWRREGER